jgi:hypothetical protein
MRAEVGWRWINLSFSSQNLTGAKYRLGEYNYSSDFHQATFPSLVPSRMYAAGAPRTLFFTLSLNYGGKS